MYERTWMIIRFAKNPFGPYTFIEEHYSNEELRVIMANTVKRMHGVSHVEPKDFQGDIAVLCTPSAKERIAKKFNLLSVPRSGNKNYIVFNGGFCVTEKMAKELM